MNQKRFKRLGPIPVDREMKDHPAFRSLNSTSILVLLDFLGKRRMSRIRKGKKKVWEPINNGELVFTYAEAETKGITRPAFVRAIDQLIEYGFLDITASGAGQFKATTLYALSDRWRAWGTKHFVEKSRPRRSRWTGRIGFQKGHQPYPKRTVEAQSQVMPT